MKTSDISILGAAEKLTMLAYQGPREYSVAISEVVGRVAAVIFLSIAAAGDLLFHSLLILPTFVYALGKSIYFCEVDLTLPWQHLQRIRNAVAPLLLGSVFGLIHPYAGLMMSEPTDKHAMLGMLSSNTNQNLETPCSPIHSLDIVEDLAKNHRYEVVDGDKKTVFSEEHIQAIQDAKSYEKSLESLQAQEFIHKITNTTLAVLGMIVIAIQETDWSQFNKHLVIALAGLLIPVLTVVDVTIALIAQAFFLVIGVVRWVTGRGPIYTEVTTDPLMHLAFLFQNILKGVGNIIGTFIWPVCQETALTVSLIPGNFFFKMQMKILMQWVKCKMESAKDNSRFVLPILYSDGECSAFSIPSHTMHKTYLIVEKKGVAFNLYWVNRPNIDFQKGLDFDTAFEQIRSMFDERFPFMDIGKMLRYPVKSRKPVFADSEKFASLDGQGNFTNCVVSNLFGMLEALDIIKGEDDISKLRYKVARKALVKDYDFYRRDFYPFKHPFSLKKIWKTIQQHPEAAI